jgi:hypothetical protein
MFIHIKFCENQSTGSEAEMKTHRGHDGLVSIFYTSTKESWLIKNGKIVRRRKNLRSNRLFYDSSYGLYGMKILNVMKSN